MDLILHPGSVKCGSSAIQDFLEKNCEALLKSGVAVINQDFKIQTQPPTNPGKVNLSKYFRELPEDDFKAFRKDIVDLIEEANSRNLKQLVLSAESLGYPENFSFHEPLKEHFDNVRVIFYIRRQDEMLLSVWQQSVSYLGFGYHEAFEAGKLKAHVNFEQAADLFEKVYGQDNLILRPVTRSLLHNHNIREDFCHRLRLNPTGISTTDAPINQSLNPHLCEIISRSCIEIKLYELARFKDKLNKLAPNSNILFKKSNSFQTANHKNSVLRSYEESNRQLHAKYFSDLSFEYVFGEVDSVSNSENELEELKNISALFMQMLLNINGKKKVKNKKQ